MKVFSFLFFLATLVATSQGVSCPSWQLGVETNNIIGWKEVPKVCENYVTNYMSGDFILNRYREDSAVVANEALLYANSQKLAGDGKDVWIFDIDETTLSNLPYFSEHGFWTEPINAESFIEWMSKSKAPALPESLDLYRELLSLGFKIVFLTERPESLRNATVKNLQNVGYNTWESLILMPSYYPSNVKLELYKVNERSKLEDIFGYRINGNMGDQWSDIKGPHPGNRTFKLPNPMYYLA